MHLNSFFIQIVYAGVRDGFKPLIRAGRQKKKKPKKKFLCKIEPKKITLNTINYSVKSDANRFAIYEKL
jgi:hypothetical protein